jgi:hypothetical protein
VAATDDPSPQRFYHGTKADLKSGDLIEPGRTPNFGKRDRVQPYVYLTGDSRGTQAHTMSITKTPTLIWTAVERGRDLPRS